MKSQFEDYQLVASSGSAFRRLGLQSESEYLAASRDPDTIWLNVEGRRLPAAVGVDVISGYDSVRCADLTGSRRPLIATVPLTVIQSDPVACEQLATVEALLVESPESRLNDDCAVARDVLRAQPASFAGLTGTGATMEFYVIGINPSEATHKADGRTSNLPTSTDEDLRAARDQGGQVLVDGTRLLADDDLQRQMWALFSDRFAGLGENHPVSMEEDEEWLGDSLARSGVQVGLKFGAEGRLESAGWIMTDTSAAFWLLPSAFGSSASSPLYFYGLASRRDATGVPGEAVLHTLGRAINQAGRPVSFYFECTEGSARYLPNLVQRYANTCPDVVVGPDVEHIDTLRYWWVRR